MITSIHASFLCVNSPAAPWEDALKKGLEHVFHYCRRLDNEKKLGAPPQMTYKRTGVDLECVIPEAAAYQWMNDSLKRAQEDLTLTIAFKGLQGQLPESAMAATDYLRKLLIIGNYFPSLPEELGKFSKLVSLTWRANNTEKLGEALRPLKFLRELNIDHNDISIIQSPEFSTLSRMRILRLSVNRITELPHDFFAAMPDLVELWLDGNHLTHLPPSLYDLPNLRALVINENQVCS